MSLLPAALFGEGLTRAGGLELRVTSYDWAHAMMLVSVEKDAPDQPHVISGGNGFPDFTVTDPQDQRINEPWVEFWPPAQKGRPKLPLTDHAEAARLSAS